MKLYTEQEVRNLLNEIFMLSSSVDDSLDSLTHIELPSDEEIRKAANSQSHYEGAMWLKQQIKQQANGK